MYEASERTLKQRKRFPSASNTRGTNDVLIVG